MKILSPTVFTKHLYAFVCTLFFFLSVSFDAYAQCPTGISLTVNSTVNNSSGVPIPDCTPITITTTVVNSTSTQQVVNLRTRFNRFIFQVLCLDDYASAADCSDPVNLPALRGLCMDNVTIPANSQRIFSIRVIYISTNPQLDGPRTIGSTVSNLTGNCVVGTIVPDYVHSNVTPLGTDGQTTTINSLPNGGTLNGALSIRGNVILNLNHTISNQSGFPNDFNFIAMNQGATLTIPNERTLTIRATNVFGCTTAWNSIVVESGGTLVTRDEENKKTTIRDGVRAIEARDGATIDVRNTDFVDNSIGVFVAPTFGNSQNINFSPFLGCTFTGTGTLPHPADGNCDFNRVNGFPEAGIDVGDVASLQLLNFAAIPRTRFSNLSNGILAARTNLVVNRVNFENILDSYTGQGGCGICSNGSNSLLLASGNFGSADVDFNNCTTGIGFHQFGNNNLAQMNSLTMNNVDVGFRTIANNFNQSFIYANRINARIGVRSLWNRSNIGEIYNNIMEITNPSDPSVSYGIIANENSTSGNWNIYGNSIDVQNAQSGIRFNSGNGAILTNNQIILESASANDSKGIQTGGSSNFNVSCNDISGSGSPSFMTRSSMFVVNGVGSTYTCNNTSSTEFGLNIIGECRPSFSMSGNRFNNHAVGLTLNNATFIGEQDRRGNKWTGAFTVLGAQHLDPNLGNVLQSRFLVGSPGTNSERFPTHSPSGWFILTGGTDESCVSLNACPNGNPAGRIAGGGGGENEAFYRSVTSEERTQTLNAEEMKWMAQRNAYGRLTDNPSEQNGRDKTAFVGRMRNSSIGQLYQVEKGIKDMKNLGQESNDLLMRNTNSTKALAYEIAELETKIASTKGNEQAALMAQKKEKNNAIYRLSVQNAPHHAAIERKRNQEIQRLLRDNERISTRLQPEINEKEVNKIYLETVAQGNMKLNREQEATVRLIAYQCPTLGGNAVFAARSLYSLVENVNFDDLALCNARSEPVQGMKMKKIENFRISPNPATDMLTVSQSSEKVEAGEWMIFDTAGKLLRSRKVGDTEIESTINIQNLSEGIYFVSFSVSGQKRFTQKLVKIKSN